VIGRSLHFLRGPGSDAATLKMIGVALNAGQPLRVELRNYRKDGTPFWVDLSLVPVPNPGGGAAHWVMIQRDITDRKAAVDALRAQRATPPPDVREHRGRRLADGPQRAVHLVQPGVRGDDRADRGRGSRRDPGGDHVPRRLGVASPAHGRGARRHPRPVHHPEALRLAEGRDRLGGAVVRRGPEPGGGSTSTGSGCR